MEKNNISEILSVWRSIEWGSKSEGGVKNPGENLDLVTEPIVTLLW